MAKPRILAHVHLYPPSHNAGAEWMAHSILTRLQRVHGFDVKVITNRPPRRRGTFDGIRVEMVANPSRASLDYRWADVAMTHLDVTRQAMQLARRHHVPLVHLIHNHQQLDYHRVEVKDAALVVWNSGWIADRVGATWPGDAMVVVPPVWCDRFDGLAGGDSVTLLNLAADKGAHLFYELARRMPDVPFLAVRGAYGEQVEPPRSLSNVDVLPNQPDVRKVYERTRVLLMPSTYESFGRCAVEAGAAGIPSIGSDAAGLVEAGVTAANLELAIEARPAVNGFARASALPDSGVADIWQAELERLLGSDEAWRVAGERAWRQAHHLERVADEQVAELAARIRALA